MSKLLIILDSNFFNLFFLSFSEGKANKIDFAFAQSNNFKRNKIQFTDVYRVKTYNAAKNTSADDLAVIFLASNVKTSKTVAVAVPSTQAVADFFVGDNLVTCGFGDIDNFRNRTKTLHCTTLRVVPVAECSATVIPGTICTKNVDGKNTCGGENLMEKSANFSKFLQISGDFGAPAYTNSSGSLQVVGVVSFHPDSRPNARCQDGHYVVLTQLGNFATFLASPKTVGTNLSQ